MTSNDEPPTHYWVDARWSTGAVIGPNNTVYQQGRGPVRWPVVVGMPPARADCLQSRPAEMDALVGALTHGADPDIGATAVLVTAANPDADGGPTSVLAGLGGVGKSQLAAEYWRAWRTGPGAEGLALWASAGNRSAVVDAYARTAAAVAEPGTPPVPDDPDAAAEWLQVWCATTGHPWLIVLDGLADPADLQRLWPVGPAGATVVTTRRTDAALRASGRTTIPVGTFIPTQSRSYLVEKLADQRLLGCDEDIDGLAADLQHLPLALAQAAAFILDRSMVGETCAQYRTRFADERARLETLFPRDALADDYQATVAVTWTISVDTADTLDPPGMARPLLELAGLLDSHGFPLEVLTSGPGRAYLNRRREARPAAPEPDGAKESRAEGRARWNPGRRRGAHRQSGHRTQPDRDSHDRDRLHRLRFAIPASRRGDTTEQDCRDALSHLVRLSLLTIEDTNGCRMVRTHALVQRASRDATPEPGPAAHAAADALLGAWTEDPRRPEIGQALRDSTAALTGNARPYLWGRHGHPVLFQAGISIGDSGQAAAARDYWTRLRADADEFLGSDSPQALAIQGNVALWQGEAGDPAHAADDLAALLDRARQQLSPYPHAVLRMRGNIAYLRGLAGDPTAAVAGYSELLGLAVLVLGPDHDDVITTRDNLARSLGEAGRAEESVAAYESLITDLERLVGADHVSTLHARHNLVASRGQVGLPTRAVTDGTRLLDDIVCVLGAQHRLAVETRRTVARLRGDAGDWAGAVAAHVDVLDDCARILGPEHPRTLSTRSTLAYMRNQAGDHTRAAAELADVLEDCVRVLGNDHPDTLTTRAHLARAHGDAGDDATAVRSYTTLLEHQQRILGPDHRYTLDTRRELARRRGRTGDNLGAASANQALLGDQLRVLGRDHPDTLATFANSLQAMTRSGASPEVLADLLPGYDTLLDDLARVLGPDHPNTLRARYNRAETQGLAGDPAAAVSAFAALVTDYRRAYGPDHPDTLTARGKLAAWRGEAGAAAHAERELKELLADMTRVLGAEHPHTRTTRHNLARLRSQHGDPNDAVAEFTALVEAAAHTHGDDHPDTLSARGNLAYARFRTGDLDGAVADYVRLVEDRRRVLGAHHPATEVAQANLESCRRRGRR